MKAAAYLTITMFLAILSMAIHGTASGDSHTPLKASFTDAKWTGITVPKGMQCQKFGGKNPSTPQLLIQSIPSNADAIVMEYSDRSWPPMDNGGHGKIGYRISPGTKEVTIASIPGHSFELPDGFFIIAPHQSPGWDKAGAYMPPCSGGAGNQYYVTIKAVTLSAGQTDSYKALESVVLEIGKY